MRRTNRCTGVAVRACSEFIVAGRNPVTSGRYPTEHARLHQQKLSLAWRDSYNVPIQCSSIGRNKVTIMNPELTVVRQGSAAKALAILCIATFWAIPFSPFVTIAALKRTKSSTGWARRLSVTAAILCSVYTVAIAVWVFCLTIYVLTGGLI